MKGKIITFFSIKGGVGKTTSCANIAAALGKMKVQTLLIDMDPIGSLSTNFISAESNNKNIIDKVNDINVLLKKKISNNVDLISSSLDLSFKFINSNIAEYEHNFAKNINELRKKYDLILIDVSSNWNSLNKMVLSNTDSVLLPIICTPYAIDAISKSLIIIRNVQINFNPKLKIEGAFINMFDKRKTDSVSLLSEATKIFQNDLYDTIIPNDSTITKLQKDNKIVVNSSSWSPSAIKFSELAKEIYKKMKVSQ